MLQFRASEQPCQQCGPLLNGRALEYLDRGGPPLHRGVDRFESVGAQDRQDGEPTDAHAVDAAQERVHPGPVLMVHLGKLARLRQRVGLIDEEHPHGDRPAIRPACAGEVLADAIERAGEQGSHLPDSAPAPGGEAQGVKSHVCACRPRDCLTENLGELGLPGADVTREDEHRRPVPQRLDGGEDLPVDAGAPGVHEGRIQEDHGLRDETVHGLV
jgi:hypothetical protein